MIAEQLLRKYPIISDQVDRAELLVILTRLEVQLQAGSVGSIVEFGCYIGTTSLFIRRLCDAYSFAGEFHVYDSFAGLPPKTSRDASPAGMQFKEGELAVSKKDFITQFKKAGLALPVIHKAWFSELDASAVPSRISFAFLHGDYYDSIQQSLELITPTLTPGATIIVDDYASDALPGASRAVDEWLAGRAHGLRVEHSLAIIQLV